MKLITTTPSELSVQQIHQLNHVAATAFEHAEDEASMLADTKAHLESADQLQIATEKDIPIALAMYRSCLWRGCY